MTQPSSPTPNHASHRLHKYVIGGIGVWILFVISFPLAYWRVSETKPYQGEPFLSLSTEETQKPADSY